MFLDDSPIREEREDLLNRSEFAKKIGNTILNLNAENGLCIWKERQVNCNEHNCNEHRTSAGNGRISDF